MIVDRRALLGNASPRFRLFCYRLNRVGVKHFPHGVSCHICGEAVESYEGVDGEGRGGGTVCLKCHQVSRTWGSNLRPLYSSRQRYATRSSVKRKLVMYHNYSTRGPQPSPSCASTALTSLSCAPAKRPIPFKDDSCSLFAPLDEWDHFPSCLDWNAP